MKNGVKKVVLAYSGGLDTSVILKWLQTEYDCEVVTFTADLGQGEELESARAKALKLGIKPENIYIEDLREEFARDFIFPMFRANAIYEGEYLLGTSIARPLIAKAQMAIAKKVGADAVSHGATGKGNDQVRFELGYLSFDPDIKTIAPWREWDLNSRGALLEFAAKHGIPIDKKNTEEAPYSMDANLLHISYEGRSLEDPWSAPEESMWRWTVSPENAPNKPEIVEIGFDRGDPVSINGENLSPAALLSELNKIGSRNGVGRLDIVENRYVGMKSRGCYETPGGSILLKARRAVESITLDRGEAHIKDELMPRYAELIYNGYWWSNERRALQAAIDSARENVSGVARVKLYKGNISVLGRKSERSLFSAAYSTFEKDEVYNQKDAAGFIRLNALRFIIGGKAKARGAFSLIELMVVIIILGILTALVAPNVLGRGEQAKQKLACVQMRQLAQSLEMFKMDNGVLPATEEGLDALASNPDPDRFKNYQNGGYLSAKQAPKDPWNKPYIYMQNDDGFEIVSLGADGKEGGENQNRDLKLSECER